MQKTLNTLVRQLGVSAGIALVSILCMPALASLPVFNGFQPQVSAAEPTTSPLPTARPICDEKDKKNCCPKGDCIIKDYIQPAINLVASMVGLAVVISYITAGIRYASSADNSQKVSEAKQRIVTTTFVLVGFFVLWSVLNYLIPGGLGP